MKKNEKSTSRKIGLPPGSLIHIGKKRSDKTRISVIDYNETEFTETEYNNIEDCFPFKETSTVSWINIDGLHNIDIIRSLGDHFELHPLLLEDLLNTNHRPKAEDFGDYIFLTLKMLGISKNGNSIVTEQVSFILGKTWVISFQEVEGDIFELVRERLRASMGNVRKLGADYLLYRLVDVVVDNYFLVTDHFNDTTEMLEDRILNSPETNKLHEIQNLKKQIIYIRKAVSPLREAISILEKDTSLIKSGTKQYLRDVYEHIIQANDSIDSQRDILASLMDLHMSGVSNRMNEVMKVLTIIATIFIPLTFIAGVYGMNFEFMPELHWKYGYVFVWGLMIAILIIMVGYFKNKKWF